MARSEGTIRVTVTQETAFDMWADLTRLTDFLPSVLEAKSVADGVYSLQIEGGESKESTRVALSVLERPRRVVWRSKGGAKWNGEIIFRPTSDGCEIRLIMDYEPRAMRQHPTERRRVVPVWNVGRDLLAFRNYVERLAVEEQEAVPV